MTVCSHRPLLVILAGLALGLGGCASIESRFTDQGPVYVPGNVRGPAAWPESIRRVAVLPAHDTTGRLPPNFVSSYDNLWRRTLDRSQRAEWLAIDRAQLATWTTRETLGGSSLLPPYLLQRIVRETDAQAVLFLDLNHCTAYPPLALSFRARLVDLSTGETLWMVDEVFDANSGPTARAARHHARANYSGVGDPTGGILQSPSLFAGYAFQAVAALLPPRVAPPPQPVPSPATSAKPE